MLYNLDESLGQIDGQTSLANGNLFSHSLEQLVKISLNTKATTIKSIFCSFCFFSLNSGQSQIGIIFIIVLK